MNYKEAKFKIGDKVIITGYPHDKSINGKVTFVTDIISQRESHKRNLMVLLGDEPSNHLVNELENLVPEEYKTNNKFFYVLEGVPVFFAEKQGGKFYSDNISGLYLRKLHEPATMSYGAIIQCLRTGKKLI